MKKQQASGLKKEPLDIDFVVDPRPLTKKEKIAISGFIKADKAKRVMKKKQPTKARQKTRTKQLI